MPRLKKKKISNQKPKLRLMTLDKEDKIKCKANRKKERLKIRAKLNEIENRKTIE